MKDNLKQEEDRYVERLSQLLPSDSHIALYNRQGELFPITQPSLWKRFKTNCVHYWDIMFGESK